MALNNKFCLAFCTFLNLYLIHANVTKPPSNGAFDDQCGAAPAERQPCGRGHDSLGECDCHARGCCFDSSSGQVPVRCFLAKRMLTGVCDVASDQRDDCGYYGMLEGECLSRGCCWKPSTQVNAPYCFFPSGAGLSGCIFLAITGSTQENGGGAFIQQYNPDLTDGVQISLREISEDIYDFAFDKERGILFWTNEVHLLHRVSIGADAQPDWTSYDSVATLPYQDNGYLEELALFPDEEWVILPQKHQGIKRLYYDMDVSRMVTVVHQNVWSYGVVVDETSYTVYWTDLNSAGGGLYSADLRQTGQYPGTPLLQSMGSFPLYLTVFADRFYWISDGALYTEGSEPDDKETLVASDDQVSGFASCGNKLYYVSKSRKALFALDENDGSVQFVRNLDGDVSRFQTL